MKKHLLLCLSLCTALAVTAQTLVPNLDSSYTTDLYEGVSNALNAAGEYTHDSACRIQTHTTTYFNHTTHQPVSSARTLYTYDADNNIYQLLTQTGDANGNTFTNSTLTTYVYEGAGLLDTLKLESWIDNHWIPATLTVLDYTVAGDVTHELDQTWSRSLNAYVNKTQYLFDYDENGNQTYFAWQGWDTLKNQWFYRLEYTDTYDSNNYQVSAINKFYNFFTYQLDATYYITYYNNSKGYPDSLHVQYEPSGAYRRTYITYFPNSNHRQYQYDYDFNANGDSTTSDVSIHFFDSTQYKYLDSSTVAFRFQGDQDYKLTFSSFNLWLYNEDSTIRTVAYGNSSYNDDGTFAYNSTSRTVSYYTPCQSVLPITLLSFTANKKDNNAILQWKTSNETNTAFFNIQRSIDGIHFTTIGTVKAAGNSNGDRSYTYTDFNIRQLSVTKVYYRLAQQDINGTVHNSAVALVDIANGKLSITLSPNPVRNSIGIYSPVAIQNAVIRITDMNGTVVYTSRSNLSAGGKLTIDASLFAKGIYYVTVQTGSGVQAAKLVKE